MPADHEPQHPWRPVSYPHQSGAEKLPDASLSDPNEEKGIPHQFPLAIQAVLDSNSPEPRNRTLVVCLDGTGDQFDNDNSNVVNFVACLKKDDTSQVTYYQSGIGTYDSNGLSNGFSAVVDMAIGSELGTHVKDAYRFLMQNYREGDKICLLGFSRGSYTVRCLAGMLHKVGLLPAHNRAQISFAYDFFKDDSEEGFRMSKDFKKTFCTNVHVYFVGVWDCVASVGFIPRKLPFSKTPTSTISYFRHAMALDEHRAKFKVSQWQHRDPNAAIEEVKNLPKNNTEKTLKVGRIRKVLGSCFRFNDPDGPEVSQNDKDQETLEYQFNHEDNSIHDHLPTDVKEVWFAGAHADVGGGSELNHKRHMLSRIPLRWMIRQCFECDTGILFSSGALAEAGIDLSTVWPIYQRPKPPVVGPSPNMVEQYEAGNLPPLQRRSTALGVDRPRKDSSRTLLNDFERRRFEADLLPEQVEDHFDSLAPINDQLELAKGWWILEFWPVKVRVQKKNSDEWDKVVRMNMGRFRAIQETEPKMHWTVQSRMNEKRYRIKNRVDRNCIWNVVA
jgi:uncharacterized protein (DUF2235 family)